MNSVRDRRHRGEGYTFDTTLCLRNLQGLRRAGLRLEAKRVGVLRIAVQPGRILREINGVDSPDRFFAVRTWEARSGLNDIFVLRRSITQWEKLFQTGFSPVKYASSACHPPASAKLAGQLQWRHTWQWRAGCKARHPAKPVRHRERSGETGGRSKADRARAGRQAFNGVNPE